MADAQVPPETELIRSTFDMRPRLLSARSCPRAADSDLAPPPQEDFDRAPYEDMTHAERAYTSKCSGLFNRASPADARDRHIEALQRTREQEMAGQRARRVDPRYSDIFHRNAAPEVDYPARRRATPEDRIGIHMDWTDSRTELLGARRPQTAEAASAAGRRNGEFRSSMDILGSPPAERPGSSYESRHQEAWPVAEDNSHKVKSSLGSSTSEIHQAHLRSSMTPDAFYSEAESAKHWRVVELHVSGLPRTTGSEDMVRSLCRGVDLQIVKVVVDMDPVHNTCKGRAKIVVRYNPDRDNIDCLVDKLQAANLRVAA